MQSREPELILKSGLVCFNGLSFYLESIISTLKLKRKIKQIKKPTEGILNLSRKKEKWKLILWVCLFSFFFFNVPYTIKRNTSVLWDEIFTVYSGWDISDILLFLQRSLIWVLKTSVHDELYLGKIKVYSVHIYLLCNLVSKINIYLFHVLINNLWYTWLNCNP